jgi:hypothetical protein
MDDPTRRCENDTGNETRFRGSRSQAGAPFYFVCNVDVPALKDNVSTEF